MCKLATASRVRFAGNTGEPTSHVMVNLSAVRCIDRFGLASLVESARARRSNLPTPAESSNTGVKRFDHRSDVTVLENRASALCRFAYDDIHDGLGQVVGPNHLVGEQQPKHRIDPP